MSLFEGSVLKIDLTTQKLSKEILEDSIEKQYIGGRGLGGYLALKEIPPHIDPLGEENVLMFLTGPLTGTPFPGTGKFVVVTKSPATGTFCDSHSSGLLAPALRFAGIKALLIRGKSTRPIYLFIEDDLIEFRSAEKIWGLDTFETEKRLRDAHGHNDVGVATIGIAGENLVKFASINSDFYRQAARGGVGAVMGSKNLKAIVVRGTGGISVSDTNRILELQKKQIEKINNSTGAQSRIKYGTTSSLPITNAAGMLPTLNFQKGTFSEALGKIDAEGILKYTIGVAGCYGCIMPCARLIEIPRPDGKIKIEGPEYETIGMFGPNIGISDPGWISKFNLLSDRLGMDTISAGSVLSFTMECVERGLVKSDDYFGLKFGNAESVVRALNAIALREGVGNELAEGVRELSNSIGQGSNTFAMHVKGLELPAYDPRAGFGTGLTYAITPRGGCHRRAWPPAKEILGNIPPYTTENKAAIVKEVMDFRAVIHSLIACDFHPDAMPISLEEYRDFIYSAVGYKYSMDELQECAERIETTIRIFNNREGFTRADDTLPLRILEEPLPDGPAKGKLFGKEGLNRMIDDYYKLRGWNTEGIPLRETLERISISGG